MDPSKAFALQGPWAMAEIAARAGSFQRYVKLGFWVLFAAVFFSIAAQWTMFTSADRQLTEYTDGLVHRAAIERLPSRDVRLLVLQKAEKLSLPVQDAGVSVTGQGETLGTSIVYNAEIRLPIVNRIVYRMEFTHALSGKSLK
jgi:hypothetical protein